MPYLRSGLIVGDPHNELFINPPASRAAAMTAANDGLIKEATTQDVTREVSGGKGGIGAPVVKTNQVNKGTLQHENGESGMCLDSR